MQLRIEAQGKYLQSVLEKAQETLGGQHNSGTIGLEAAKIQLSDFMSKVSTQCLNSAFSGMKELSDFCLQQKQATQPTDCSFDSCLTSSFEGSLRAQELYNNLMGLKPTEQRDNKNETRKFFSTANDSVDKAFLRETNSSNLSMSIGLQGGTWNGGGDCREERFKADADIKIFGQNTDSNEVMKPEKQKTSSELKLPLFLTKLDLNTDDENDAASSCKKLDLNGFSWS